MNIRFFSSDIEGFIHSLEEATIAKVLRTIDLLEMFGNKLGPPHSKKIRPRLFELRVRGKQEVRILYTFYKGEAILLLGFIKKTERLPKKELESALQKIRMLDTK